MGRPVQLPAARRAADRPRRLAVRPALLAAGRALGAGASRGTCFCCWSRSRLALFTYLWLRELEPAAARGCARRARVRARAVPAPTERRTPARLDRRARAARALGLRALAPRRSACAAAHLWGTLAAASVVSIPLSGQLHLALGVAPVRRRLRGRSLLAHRPRSGPGAGRSPPPPPGSRRGGRHRGLDGVRGEDARRGRLLLRRPPGRRQPVAPARAGALRLPRLAPAGARGGRARPAGPPSARAGDPPRPRRARAGAARAGDEPAALRAAARRLPAAPLPARARALPAASKPRAGCTRGGRGRRRLARFEGRRRTAVGAALSSRWSPPTCSSSRCARATRIRETPPTPRSPTQSRAASSSSRSSSAGKAHFGSVYQYYTQQAPRERPTGYALAPEEVFEFTARFNRLDCGAWLPGDQEELERLGVRYFVWHGGLYRQSETPGAWYAMGGPSAQGSGSRPGPRRSSCGRRV